MDIQGISNQRNFIMAGLAVGALAVVAISQYNKPNFPCYCKPCEQELIDAANAGDINAQEKLGFAIQGGAYQGQGQGLMGPMTMIVGLVVVVFMVSQIGGLGQRYAAPVTGFMESSLRGR
jgi:hypothetical protein